MKKIIVVGANGKMGKLACEKLRKNYEVVKVDIFDDIFIFDADLVLDFGSAESSVTSAKFCIKNEIPLIVASTGQNENEMFEINQVAKVAPLLVCKNFSFGNLILINILKTLALPKNCQITILEKHHKHKKDKPSGTALTIKEQLEASGFKGISILSERGGEEIGTHKIDFYFGSEFLSFEHKVFSRDVFVENLGKIADFMLKTKNKKQYCLEEILLCKL